MLNFRGVSMRIIWYIHCMSISLNQIMQCICKNIHIYLKKIKHVECNICMICTTYIIDALYRYISLYNRFSASWKNMVCLPMPSPSKKVMQFLGQLGLSLYENLEWWIKVMLQAKPANLRFDLTHLWSHRSQYLWKRFQISHKYQIHALMHCIFCPLEPPSNLSSIDWMCKKSVYDDLKTQMTPLLN